MSTTLTSADADTRSDGAISIIPLNQEAWPTDYFSKELRLMAATVTRLELWDWFRIESPPEDTGYSWWNHPNINKISDKTINPSPIFPHFFVIILIDFFE